MATSTFGEIFAAIAARYVVAPVLASHPSGAADPGKIVQAYHVVDSDTGAEVPGSLFACAQHGDGARTLANALCTGLNRAGAWL